MAMLLQPASFASAVICAEEQLKNISKIVLKYCGQAKADGFLKACGSVDYNTANAILDDMVEVLTGYDSVPMALSMFAEKFPGLSPELGNKVSKALSEFEKVKAIESYRTEILEIINGDR